jgi:hypothetical protein
VPAVYSPGPTGEAFHYRTPSLVWLAIVAAVFVVALVSPRAVDAIGGALAHLVRGGKALGRWLVRHALPVVVTVHVALFLLKRSALLSTLGTPYAFMNYAHHLHVVRAAAASLPSGHFATYDPWFLAGYPAGTIFDVDLKLTEAVCFAMSKVGVSIDTAFSLDVIAKNLVAPFLIYAAAGVLRLSRAARIVALLVAVIVWHSYPPYTGFNQAGTYNFIFVCYFAPLVLALYMRWAETFQLRHLVLGALAGALLLGFHLLGPVLLLFPALVVVASAVKRQPRRGMLGAAVLAGVPAVVNLPWILDALHAVAYRAPTGLMQSSALDFLFSVITGPHIVLILIGGLVAIVPRKPGPLAGYRVPLLIGLFVNAVFSIAGSSYPGVRDTEPLRYMCAVCSFAIVPFAQFVADSIDEARALRGGYPRAAVISISFVVAALTGLTFLSVGDAATVRATLRAANDTASWLREATTPSGRILFQDASASYIPTPAAVQSFYQREFIGGPFSRINLKHRFAAASSDTGMLFDKKTGELDEADWKVALSLYDIAYVVAVDEALRAALDRHPALFRKHSTREVALPVWRFGKGAGGTTLTLQLYEVRVREPGRLVEGRGEVSADFNVIRVRNASAGGVTLPYHWMRGARTEPPLPVTPTPQWRDPIPFLHVDNGDVKDFDIRFR